MLRENGHHWSRMSKEQMGPLGSPEVSVKLFVEDSEIESTKELIPVFHRWIKKRLIEDELLVDVTSYAHVPKGPGIMLICDKAQFYFDEREGRSGLRYRGRRASDVTGVERIKKAFRSALHAASLLENDPELDGRYRFHTSEFEFGIYDRLRAPSDNRTLAAVEPMLRDYVESLFGEIAEIKLTSAPKEPFMVTVRMAGSPSVDELLGRVAARD